MTRAIIAALLAVTMPGIAIAQGAAEPATVTFTNHVAPILQRACQVCHRPGSIAPMSLLTYDEARL